MNLKEMNTGDRVILAGNLLGSLVMTPISLEGNLRTTELPEIPIFSTEPLYLRTESREILSQEE